MPSVFRSLGNVLQKRLQWRPMGSTKIGRCLTPLLWKHPLALSFYSTTNLSSAPVWLILTKLNFEFVSWKYCLRQEDDGPCGWQNIRSLMCTSQSTAHRDGYWGLVGAVQFEKGGFVLWRCQAPLPWCYQKHRWWAVHKSMSFLEWRFLSEP